MDCWLFIAWAVSSTTLGPIVGYDFAVDGEPTVQTDTNTYRVCLNDTDTHYIQVRGFTAEGRGPWSDMLVGTLAELRAGARPRITPSPIPSVTPTPTASTTPTATTTPTGTPTPVPTIPPAVAADIDGNGQVGFEDYSAVMVHFGTCNDGEGKVVPCE